MKTQLIKAVVILVGLSLASSLASTSQGSTKNNIGIIGSQNISLRVVIFGFILP